jgi:hypothetical protein
LKFGLKIPDNVCDQCGPITRKGTRRDLEYVLKTEPPVMPPLLLGEYDATIPVTDHGLLMNVGEVNGCVAFLGYRSLPDGSKGPAEVQNLIRNTGDKIISVDGISTVCHSNAFVCNRYFQIYWPDLMLTPFSG